MDELRDMLSGPNGFVSALASLIVALLPSCKKIFRQIRIIFTKNDARLKNHGVHPVPLSPSDQRKRLHNWVRIVFGSLAIALLIFAILPPPPPPPAPPPPTRDELLIQAWNSYNGKNWPRVKELTTSLLDEFGLPAEKKQKELTTLNESEPKTGRVGVDLSDTDVQRNHSFGLINDVATALYLRGEANSQMKIPIAARTDWEKVMTFTHAVTFDVRSQEFWRTKDGAENKLSQVNSMNK